MTVILPSLTMPTINTTLTMTIRHGVMNLARHADKPTTAAAARQSRPVATATR